MVSDNLHTRILDNLKTAILVADADLSISYLNSAAEALLEVSGNRLLGEPVIALFTDRDDNLANLRDALAKHAGYTRRETSLTLPSGQQITVDYAVTPIAEVDGGRMALILELQPLDRLLRIAREEGLISSHQNTQALVRGLAHEIKNPLGGLRGAAQLLAKELPDSGLADYTNVIIEEADRLRNLVDRLLGPNKLREFEPVNIHEVLERVRTLIEAETKGSVTLARDYDPSLPEILGDKEQLIQALFNIVRNAVQALQHNPGTERPRVELKTRALRQFTIGTERHRLVCSVDITDNGPGIPPELQETLFLPMVSGRPEGSGLGLSIAQSILNRHRGLIECNSRPGRTTFSLYIPLERKG